MSDEPTHPVHCGECDLALDESPSTPVAERQPCPRCGNTEARHIEVTITDEIEVSDAVAGAQTIPVGAAVEAESAVSANVVVTPGTIKVKATFPKPTISVSPPTLAERLLEVRIIEPTSDDPSWYWQLDEGQENVDLGICLDLNDMMLQLVVAMGEHFGLEETI